MPSEPLGEEEVLRGTVDVRDGRVAESVEIVVALEARHPLPAGKVDLDLPQGDPPTLP